MFRDGVDELADDLASFIHQVFCGPGYRLPNGGRLRRNEKNGAIGDATLICSSPREYSSGGNSRLPLLLRQALEAKRPGIRVFNPRGQELCRVPIVELFGGLLLNCLDGDANVEADTSGIYDARDTFTRWRTRASQHLSDRGANADLRRYVKCWARRQPDERGMVWPRSVPVLDLFYGVLHFFSRLYDDPEGQVYVEAFARQASACEQVGKFKGRIVSSPSEPQLSQASIKELLRDFLAPVASGAIGVNEDLLEVFPRDRLSILSAHQAKGLEFPLTIVDVGSDFRTKHRTQTFRRFPDGSGSPYTMEDLLGPCTPLGAPVRSAQNRAFDDLYRLYFVAFSRPRDVLLLVALRGTLPGGPIPNVATGWSRDGTCRWKAGRTFLEL